MKNLCGSMPTMMISYHCHECKNRITPNNLTHAKKAMASYEDYMLYMCVGFSLTFKGGVSFVRDLFCYLCFVSVMLSGLSIAVLWPPAGKGLAS